MIAEFARTYGLWSYAAIAGVAALVTVLAVPVCRVVALSRGYVVAPDERRAHGTPTPHIGGGAMYLGFITAVTVAWLSGWFDAVFSDSTEPLALVLAATVAYLVGLVDDIRELSPPAKLAGLIVVGTLLFFGGISIIWFRIPFFDLLALSLDLSYVITILWVLGLANAVNFIDGLDGLAAGIVGIGAFAFLLYSLRLVSVGLLLESNIGPLTASMVFGICLGFLPWNTHPAKIFMGDGGSLLLGCMMAASTMAVGGRTNDPFSGQTFFFYAPLVIPLVILGVPVLDTAFAIIRRASRRRGLATADRDHLHHRLIRMGHGHRRAVAILWAWTALLSGFVLWPVYNEGRGDAIVPAGVMGLAALLFVSLKPGFGREIDESSREVDEADRGTSSPGTEATMPALASSGHEEQQEAEGGDRVVISIADHVRARAGRGQPATRRSTRTVSVPNEDVDAR